MTNPHQRSAFHQVNRENGNNSRKYYTRPPWDGGLSFVGSSGLVLFGTKSFILAHCMPLHVSRGSLWAPAVLSVLVPFAILALGFRLLYDSVIPEVFGLVVTGAVLSYMRPRYAWLWLIGIGVGIFLSERVFPATPPLEHVARYGPPVRGGVVDLLKICGFPAAGSIIGLVLRVSTPR